MQHARYLPAVLLLLSGILAGEACTPAPAGPAPAGPAPAGEDIAPANADVPAWMDIELTDVRTGRAFRISDFKGKPVLVESFAVWCPTCTAQQKEIARLKDRAGEEIAHISLDTDPNEDEAKIREHLDRNGFDWLYAVSPVELTQALIDEFGLGVVNAPGAPIVLICEDQSTRFLGSGLKTADELRSQVEQGCE